MCIPCITCGACIDRAAPCSVTDYCPECNSFLPPDAIACPQCYSYVGRRANTFTEAEGSYSSAQPSDSALLLHGR